MSPQTDKRVENHDRTLVERSLLPPSQSPDPALVQRQLTLILSSHIFFRSEQISALLTAIVELSLRGEKRRLTERNLGTLVFGKKAGWDPRDDTIVRSEARRLRRKLREFYEGGGPDSLVVIDLPLGAYMATFRQSLAANSTSSLGQSAATASPKDENGPTVHSTASPVPEFAKGTGDLSASLHVSESDFTMPSSQSIASDVLPSKPKHAPVRRVRVGSIGWVLGAGLLLLLLFLYRERLFSGSSAASAVSSPPLPLWRVLFLPGQRTMVVPSDAGLVMWHAATNQRLSLNDYLSGRYLAESAKNQTAGQLTHADLASRRYTSITDLRIVEDLTQIADGQHNNLKIHYARDLRPDELKDGNIVLIGAQAANPWVDLFEPNMNFVFARPQNREYTILNRTPLRGEPAEWTSNLNDTQRVYGVVAFMPNLNGNGHVLILEGTSSPGTECAWDFVSNDLTLLPFLNSIKRADRSVPHFQVVVECTNLTGSSVERHLVAWRTMK